MKKRACMALLVFALAACGGGGVSSRSEDGVPPAAAQSHAVFVVALPANAPSAATRRADYISPNTQSLTIAVNGAAPSVTANLTPGSDGCTTSSGTTTCRIAVSAPTGTDQFTVVLYSGTNATGAMLGTGSVSANVSSEPTPVDIILDGVVSSVAISLGNDAPPAGTPATIPVTIIAKDASGATIISPGKFSAPIMLTDSDTSGHTSLSSTIVSDPDAQVTLSYDGSAAVTSATISAATGGTLTSVTPATLTPQIAPPAPALNVSPTTLSFTVPDAASAIDVSETGYGGAFDESDDCASIATVSPASARGSSTAFTVTSVGAGQCTVTISDENGQSKHVTIHVTITQGVIQ